MFTGIVRGKGIVERVSDRPNLRTIEVALPLGSDEGLEVGASIAVDGVCLTVTSTAGGRVEFDIMGESLARTTLGSLHVGAMVNIERAARDGAEVGGHCVSGHIDCVCEVVQINTPENNVVFTFQVPKEYMQYVFPKGYIALNGASLTVSNVSRHSSTFDVWLIPETLRLTTFGEKGIGSRVNLEVERSTQVIVDTVNTFLEGHFGEMLPKLKMLLNAN